jgi:hypothetical protein
VVALGTTKLFSSDRPLGPQPKPVDLFGFLSDRGGNRGVNREGERPEQLFYPSGQTGRRIVQAPRILNPNNCSGVFSHCGQNLLAQTILHYPTFYH